MENTTSQITQPQKRNTAFKQRIGAILSAKQNIENEKLKNIDICGSGNQKVCEFDYDKTDKTNQNVISCIKMK